MIFDKQTAGDYDSWYLTPQGAFIDQVESRAALELFDPHPGQSLLDAGCGTGNFSFKLGEIGCVVTGVDISPPMLALARSKASKHNLPVKFLEMDLEHLAFPDSSFDGVLSMAAWEFVYDQNQVFGELMRVLKPGGCLVIGTINLDSPWGELYQEITARDSTSVFNHARFKSWADLDALGPDHMLARRGCLFIPPSADPASFNWNMELKLSATERPGFIVGLWQKQGFK